MMGFRLETATGTSISIKAQKRHGAPTTINLESLLEQPAGKREKWIQDHADRKLGAKVVQAVKTALRTEDLHAALLPVIDFAATPDVVARGVMVLQPSEERRRSGSHYTPRTLTEPIVRTTLRPILERLHGATGKAPRPEEILDLKVCDPAMGSGAFLVEACRQLAEALMEAWAIHGGRPPIPADEDEIVFARRLVAQRCLYGVDRNPVAVDLAKVSLWLVTLAKDHALTFVDHALRHGDSLVGLSRRQIEAFHWDPDAPCFQAGFEVMKARDHLVRIAALRRRIREAGEDVSDLELRDLWDEAQFELGQARLLGDLVLAAWFETDKPKEREERRLDFANAVVNGAAETWRGWLEERRYADPPLVPFHWEVEFPEVFDGARCGFDGVVGNPPFLGGSQLSEMVGGPGYQEWLKELFTGAFGNADLCAYFFRRAFDILCEHGTIGFAATKTIAEGGTRTTGLKHLIAAGGFIYHAVRARRWPGQATVMFTIVHLAKHAINGSIDVILGGARVPAINSRLHAHSETPDPVPLRANGENGFFGTKLGGNGFVLESDEFRELSKNSKNVECLLPYLAGEEMNRSPTQSHERYAISFGSRPLDFAEQFPDLLRIIETRVKPARELALDHGPGKHGKRYWWQHVLRADPLYAAISSLSSCLATARTTAHLAFSFQPIRQVFSESILVFAFDRYSAFCCLQSSPHVLWALLFSTYMGETLRYSISEAFQTFPFPVGFLAHSGLEEAGRAYYEHRANVMLRNNEGLTKTYNRFHDPDHMAPEIVKLRALHVAMDRVVLDAYGWNDIPTDCEFLLDSEIDEEEWSDKKKPYRYRWPDDVRDEVLARLLELNAERARAEALAGAATGSKRASKPKANSAAASPDLKDLFS